MASNKKHPMAAKEVRVGNVTVVTGERGIEYWRSIYASRRVFVENEERYDDVLDAMKVLRDVAEARLKRTGEKKEEEDAEIEILTEISEGKSVDEVVSKELGELCSKKAVRKRAVKALRYAHKLSVQYGYVISGLDMLDASPGDDLRGKINENMVDLLKIFWANDPLSMKEQARQLNAGLEAKKVEALWELGVLLVELGVVEETKAKSVASNLYESFKEENAFDDFQKACSLLQGVDIFGARDVDQVLIALGRANLELNSFNEYVSARFFGPNMDPWHGVTVMRNGTASETAFYKDWKEGAADLSFNLRSSREDFSIKSVLAKIEVELIYNGIDQCQCEKVAFLREAYEIAKGTPFFPPNLLDDFMYERHRDKLKHAGLEHYYFYTVLDADKDYFESEILRHFGEKDQVRIKALRKKSVASLKLIHRRWTRMIKISNKINKLPSKGPSAEPARIIALYLWEAKYMLGLSVVAALEMLQELLAPVEALPENLEKIREQLGPSKKTVKANVKRVWRRRVEITDRCIREGLFLPLSGR